MRYHRTRLRPNITNSRETKSSMWGQLGALLILALIISAAISVVVALNAANDWRKENACPAYCTKAEVIELQVRKDVEEIERATRNMMRFRTPLPPSSLPRSPGKAITIEI